MSVQYFIVEDLFEGKRIDNWFKHNFPYINHNYLEKLIRTGQVRINGSRVKSSYRLKCGEKIRVPPNLDVLKPNSTNLKKTIRPELVESIIERVLYFDENLLIINKPQGLPVQGGAKIRESLDDISDLLRLGVNEKPRLVHRLDKDTGGVLLLARNAQASVKLAKMFSSRHIRKLYLGLVENDQVNDEGIINLPLIKAKTPLYGERIVVDKTGKSALTIYRRIVSVKGFSLLALSPITGRKHQLRVHCAALNMPIVGDMKYGTKRIYFPFFDKAVSMQLFARSVQIKDFEGINLLIKAPIPEYMERNFTNLEINIDEKDIDDLSFIKNYH